MGNKEHRKLIIDGAQRKERRRTLRKEEIG
jgi:hypothetical protein